MELAGEHLLVLTTETSVEFIHLLRIAGGLKFKIKLLSTLTCSTFANCLIFDRQ